MSTCMRVFKHASCVYLHVCILFRYLQTGREREVDFQKHMQRYFNHAVHVRRA